MRVTSRPHGLPKASAAIGGLRLCRRISATKPSGVGETRKTSGVALAEIKNAERRRWRSPLTMLLSTQLPKYRPEKSKCLGDFYGVGQG